MSINIENITVSYQKHPAVHHVSHVFNEGESWAIFGPNGAGKSTLLKAIMQLLPVDTGKVVWQGLARKDIAYLPQQSEIDRDQPMTVFELVAMGLWYELGFFGGINRKQKERIVIALERVDMQGFENRMIGELSNGQFQRVLFARMLVQEAKFLLLDEPFNAVDAATTEALLQVLKNAMDEGKSIVTVLHDIEQVKKHIPNALLLAKEKIAVGASVDVLTAENLQIALQMMQPQHTLAPWCATS